jgi:hypothetical protein
MGLIHPILFFAVFLCPLSQNHSKASGFGSDRAESDIGGNSRMLRDDYA